MAQTGFFLSQHPNVNIEYGIDRTGNLLHIDNFEYCVKKYGGSMDLVTADGGFDFSKDFNHQEISITNLLWGQVCYALCLQKQGGNFVLKIFDIFYEHVNYFRLSDFSRIFGRVVHADRGFGGQYLRIIGDLATLRRPERDASDPVAFPADFTARLAQEAGEELGPCIVWGGASKGVIFSLLRERAGYPVDRVIDINPAKQGKYLAATGLRVMGPAEGLAGLPKGSVIHVMNPNYLTEIQAMAGPDFICKGMSHD